MKYLVSTLFAITLLCGCASHPEFVPAAGHLEVGTMLYFRDHTRHGRIVDKSTSHQFSDGTVAPGILVDQGNNVVLWENPDYAGQIFLVIENQ